MHFIVTCTDKPGSAALRQEHRPAHLAYVEQNLASVGIGGALLNAEGAPIGSMLILEVPDRASAQAMMENDPFFKAGLWPDFQIVAYRPSIGTWVGGRIG